MSSECVNIFELLRKRYDTRNGKWVTAAEVGNGTGTERTRACDFMAMHCWPSGGLKLYGHEVKVSRSDWQREMQDIDKSYAFIKHCHYWWLVTTSGVARLEEIPGTWGLLVCGKTSIRVAKPATLNKDPELSWSFVAAFLRAATQQADITKQMKQEYQRGWSDAVKRNTEDTERIIESKCKYERSQLEALKHDINNFEEASGVRIKTWNGQRIGEAFALAQSLQHPRYLNENIARAISQTRELEKALHDLHSVAQQGGSNDI